MQSFHRPRNDQDAFHRLHGTPPSFGYGYIFGGNLGVRSLRDRYDFLYLGYTYLALSHTALLRTPVLPHLVSATVTSSADIQTRQAFAIRFLREVALRPHHSSAFGYTTLRPSGTIGLWARPTPPHHLGRSIGQAFHLPALRVPLPPLCPSNYRVFKPQANKCPLEPNTKQAPAQTSHQAKHNLSHPRSSILVPPSSFLHSIFILLLCCRYSMGQGFGGMV
jgi:hypothetical protein